MSYFFSTKVVSNQYVFRFFQVARFNNTAPGSICALAPYSIAHRPTCSAPRSLHLHNAT